VTVPVSVEYCVAMKLTVSRVLSFSMEPHRTESSTKLSGILDLATSRYQAADLIEASGRAAVGITLGYPRFKLRYPIVANLRQLAPTREMLQVKDACTFEGMYRHRLDDLGVVEARRLLDDCAERANNDHLLMLCYEDLTKPGLRCHRRLFSAWWEARTGEAVPELEPEVRQGQLFL